MGHFLQNRLLVFPSAPCGPIWESVHCSRRQNKSNSLAVFASCRREYISCASLSILQSQPEQIFQMCELAVWCVKRYIPEVPRIVHAHPKLCSGAHEELLISLLHPEYPLQSHYRWTPYRNHGQSQALSASGICHDSSH